MKLHPVRWLRRRTLVRRVLWSLFWVFFVVWLVLVVWAYKASTDHEAMVDGVRKFGEIIAQSLDNIQDEKSAAIFAQGIVEVQNRVFVLDELPLVMYLQLFDQQGRALYGFPDAREKLLHNEIGNVVDDVVDGREVLVYSTQLTQWKLVIARPNVSPRWALVTIAMQLLPYLLIAFALIAAFVWVAVERGLRPLREMSLRIAARHPGDLSATGIVARYEEMIPLQRALDDMLSTLRIKVGRETAFVQEAAHELRTPLAVISAQAHVIAMARTPPQRRAAEHLLDSALLRTSHLIGQLLQLAHVGGERSLALTTLDMADLVREQVASVVPAAMRRNIDISADVPDALPWSTEPQTMMSVLENLLGNAIRYVNDGDRIVVGLVHLGPGVVISVSDNGPGIAADQRELVFERFHRGNDHTAPGAGLGLAIVRQACNRLGGNVRLETGLDGRGCQFVVWLPLMTQRTDVEAA